MIAAPGGSRMAVVLGWQDMIDAILTEADAAP